MEAVTAGADARTQASTGSKTIADLLPLAAEKFADAPAIRHKVGDEWKDIPYSQLGDTVREVALGLIDLGLQPGDKISILAHTRPEWSYACFGILTAGATLVTIYQTNSPEECQYVLSHSDSRAIFVEDAEQLAKVREIEERCPELQHVIVMEPGDADLGDAITLDALRERGRARDESEWRARYEAVTPDDMCLYIYTSGTTGPPKGCLLSHANYRAITDAVGQQSVLEGGDCSYLFLPLAHAFAILIQFASFDLGVTLAYWSRDPKMIIADIAQVSPSYFPSVPRMFEKIYTLATANVEDRRAARAGREARREGAHDARGRAGGAGGAAAALRRRRGEAVQERARAVRPEHPRVRDRRGADRPRDPRVLLRLRGAGDGGLRDDRDRHERHRQPGPGQPVPLRLGGQGA